jgi:hypothetical protein
MARFGELEGESGDERSTPGALLAIRCPAMAEATGVHETCTHLDQIQEIGPSSPGCEDCLAAGSRNWVHLRVCQACGHVGCCDNSPGRHATAHHRATAHAIVRSYEPGEDWYFCYVDDMGFELEGAPSAPSHP